MESTLDLDQALPSEYIAMMASYIESHHMTEIVQILNAVDCSAATHYALPISVIDLLYENSALGSLLLHHPGTLLPYFDEAIREVQDRVIAVHEDTLWMNVKTSCHARLHHLPCCPELCKPTVSSIRAVRRPAAPSWRATHSPALGPWAARCPH